MKGKWFILHYPSNFGMGSDVDEYLISESDLKKLIQIELEKKAERKHFLDRLTGTWDNEKFCDSSDIEEVIQDIITKRLSTCSTYANVNDLIEIPANAKIAKNESTLENIIFHIWNPFDCDRDIIIGEITFRETTIHLDQNISERFKSGNHKFINFNAKHILENHCFYESFEESIKTHRERMQRVLELPEKTEKHDEWIRESKANIEKLGQPISSSTDEYLTHVYIPKDRTMISRRILKDLRKMRTTDFRKLPYEYPLAINTLGAIYTHHREDANLYRYDELFNKGMDAELIPSLHVGQANTPDDSLLMPIFLVFGYE